MPDEEDDDDADEGFPRFPVPIVVPERVAKPTGGAGVLAVVELLPVALPPRVLPQAAIDFGPPPAVPFVPFVPSGGRGGFVPPPPMVTPWPVETVSRPTFVLPDDPFGGGMTGSTPPLIEGLEKSGGLNLNPADVARALGIAIAATIVVAAISRGVPPAVARQVASIVGVPGLLPSILGTAERALIDSVDESIEPTLEMAPGEEFWSASGSPDPDPVPVGTGPRGSRPPLLFNAQARMQALLQGVTRDF